VPLCGVAASRRADLLVCGSFDGWVYLVNENGLPLGRIETDGEVWSVACSDDAALICLGSGDHTVRLIDNWCSVAPIREVNSFESSVVMECGHLAYLSIYNENQKDIIRKNSPSTKSMREMLEKAGFSGCQYHTQCA
jgi:WD40 repeat protein